MPLPTCRNRRYTKIREEDQAGRTTVRYCRLSVRERQMAGIVGAGMDLTGAVELRFWARGEKGGEIVDFFTLGFDWTSGQLVNPKSAAADSNASINLRNVRLEKEWKEYSIPLDGADLTCIANGFGYAMDDSENHHLYLDSKTPGAQDPFIALLSMNDSNISFITRSWVNAPDYWPVKFDLNKKIYETLPQNGIHFAYPQLNVTIKN